jgi:hypothetical protein
MVNFAIKIKNTKGSHIPSSANVLKENNTTSESNLILFI